MPLNIAASRCILPSHPAHLLAWIPKYFARPKLDPGMKRKIGVILENTNTSARYSTRTSPARMRTIDLSPKEQQLRLLLLDVAKSIDNSGYAPEPVVLRWAGGWVRDKLLGIESHDIDVAINAMTGVTFAERMCDYCETPEAISKHQIGKNDIGNLHNVARNPDKSKHLETAMVKMFGLDIDFVNLRKEVYSDQSRNPQVEFGTAEEDALRRDATINALFYNLHTDRIEDFTGGLPDIKAKLIRTPLDPLKTFTDDPLRVLRLVRFASRLDFSIDPNTERFMGNEKVLDSLRAKISRERVGIELEKMLKGKTCRPLVGRDMIADNGSQAETPVGHCISSTTSNSIQRYSPTLPKRPRTYPSYLDGQLLMNALTSSLKTKHPNPFSTCWFAPMKRLMLPGTSLQSVPG